MSHTFLRPPVPRFRMVYALERESQGKPVALRARWGLQVLQGNASPVQTQLTQNALNHMLEALYKIDVDYLRAYPNTPRLYDAWKQRGLHYMEEPPGQEEWQDIPTVLRMGFGDCVPLDTPVVVHNMNPSAEPEAATDGSGDAASKWTQQISGLKPGDWIWGDATGRLVRVEGIALTGKKPIRNIFLSGRDDAPLRVSPNHRVFLYDRTVIRASDLTEGMSLYASAQESRTIRRIVDDLDGEECMDITTSDGTFFIWGPDVMVHNCEDLASWLAAERTVKDGLPARPIFISQGKRPDGANLYHIVVQHAKANRFAPRYPFQEDPSRVMGMR